MSVKLKLALVWFVGLAGVEVMVGVGGAVVSMVQVKLAAPLWLPVASCALTENVWLPWSGARVGAGLEQALNALPSSWQRKLTPA